MTLPGVLIAANSANPSLPKTFSTCEAQTLLAGNLLGSRPNLRKAIAVDARPCLLHLLAGGQASVAIELLLALMVGRRCRRAFGSVSLGKRCRSDSRNGLVIDSYYAIADYGNRAVSAQMLNLAALRADRSHRIVAAPNCECAERS